MESVRRFIPAFKHTGRVLASPRYLRRYSTENPQAQEVTTRQKINLTKPSPVKWKRPPFMKNFFIGKFDTELCAFPEILDKDQVTELESTVKIINDIMVEKSNSTEIDKKQQLPESLLNDLKELGLFGRLVPRKYGGLDLTHTAFMRINEALSLDWSTSATLAAHESFATQIILQFGSEEQKSRLLPRLASGNLIAAVCCSEFESGADPISIATVCSQTSDDQYTIDGTKAWVTNAELADLFIVFAKMKHPVDPNMHEISVFLVERDTKGLTVLPQNNICLCGSHSGVVKFEDVIVPVSNLIGSPGLGFFIYLKALESLRISIHSFTFGTLKVLFDAITEHVIHTERVERSVGDQQLVRRRLSKINSVLYAMESMSYFTAAILDSTDNPDISFESAALKIFNSEGTLYCLQEMQQLMGSSSLLAESSVERYMRDAMGIAMMDGPNDIARLFIGLNGLQFAGKHKADEIEKARNPFFYPMDRFKEHYKEWKINRNQFGLDQDIAGHYHPTLVEWGNNLEANIQKFNAAVSTVLTAHGPKVVEIQIDPMKLADTAIDMYAMAAVMSRCSRSYCIGLANAHHEIRVGQAFCFDACSRIVRNINDIFAGMTKNNEGNHLLLGTQLIDCKGYFAEHPLKHNY